MANETVARRYAVAVFQLATEQNAVNEIRSDLASMKRSILTEESVAHFFRSPVVDRAHKTSIFSDSFGLTHPVALQTLLLLIRKRREALFGQIVTEFEKLVAAAHGTAPLKVTSARELSAAELGAMVDRLSSLYKTKFTVEQRVDPTLIGGVRLMMGDRLVDGTVAGALDDLARSLQA